MTLDAIMNPRRLPSLMCLALSLLPCTGCQSAQTSELPGSATYYEHDSV